ncbi:MAG: CoA transferase [Ideonella sp.]|nr:CoA transferase [Ideonella sp.]
MGVLDGVKIVEVSALGPAPLCAAMLADLGADVITVERPADDAGMPRPTEIYNRGKRSVVLDLKHPGSCDIVLELVDDANVLIEGMRPGVMERLGLGPDVCFARKPSLVYARMTGWGQDGPLKRTAGHDGNYIAISGALSMCVAEGLRPEPPPGLMGDVAGGALYCAIGILAAVLRARREGVGQVVDAAMVDGSAHLMNHLLSGADTRMSAPRAEAVLSLPEAARHPHNVARELYASIDGVLQVRAAPRFLSTPSAPTARVPARGQHTKEIMEMLGRRGA